MIRIGKLVNPFYIYILIFSFALLLWQLKWSDMFPSISTGLLLFLLCTFAAAGFLGWFSGRLVPALKSGNKVQTDPLIVAIPVSILFAAEFMAYGGIPLFQALGGNFDKKIAFGIKTLHPVLITFSSFYSVFVFHQVLQHRSARRISALCLFLALPLLCLDRGAFLMIVSSMFFLLLFTSAALRIRTAVFISALAFVFAVGFGTLGNFRESGSASNSAFLDISKASRSFREAPLPGELMWTYMYIASPLANLQSNINSADKGSGSLRQLVLTEFIPDFISKRIAPAAGVDRAELMNISADFTVATAFARPYILKGWGGMVLMFAVNSVFIIVCLVLARHAGPYGVTVLALLCTFSVCTAFTNMIYFSGMSLQLAYPLIFGLVDQYRMRRAEG